MFDQFTLGIEEEFQIVDPLTRELRSHVTEFLDEGRMILGEQIKPEMIQSQIEVGTGICKNIQEARADISNLRGVISSLAEKNGLKIVAASTHPISRWQDQTVFEDERYELLVEELQATKTQDQKPKIKDEVQRTKHKCFSSPPWHATTN